MKNQRNQSHRRSTALEQNVIRVTGAREHNLKNIHVDIPKQRITLFTGVSGSGKSSLVFDTIAAESQRQLNETFNSFVRHRLPHYGQPEADSLENLSVAIIIDQHRLGSNARSTVGTVTDIHPLLRLLFSRAAQPFAGYSYVYSFNHPEGMCPQCEGLGTVAAIDIHRFIDREKSLNEGAVNFPTFAPGTWRWKRYFDSGFFDPDKKLKNYTPEEWDTLLYKDGITPPDPLSGFPKTGTYEGLIPRFERSYLVKDSAEVTGKYKADFERVVTKGVCPQCKGARLNATSLRAQINGRNIADGTRLQITDLIPVIQEITLPVAVPIVQEILARLEHMVTIGLGYLSLDRETNTLSGGESQRIKMVKHLGSSLAGLTYIFDEPSSGLHPRDVHQLNQLMQELRDKGNTLLIVEHDPDVFTIADHVIDMGPGAGIAGGHIVYQGDLAGLHAADTLTGEYLRRKPRLKSALRKAKGALVIAHASLHNLKDVTVHIPKAVMTVVTGVAGAGKSSLVNGLLAQHYPETVYIDQSAIRGSRRSNPATYTGLLDLVRQLFAAANKVSVSLFSSNAAGACPACKGLGLTYTDLAFMDPVVSVCEVCQGKRFVPEVLGYHLRGKDISEVLDMSVATAAGFFEEPLILAILQRLSEAGLDYITLGQPLSTLSGGERQRIKLATVLENSGQIYVLDEPTTGLHMSDIQKQVQLLNRLVDGGSTVIVIEHNLDVICQADWIIDMGPGAGRDGGRVVFEGTPAELTTAQHSVTGQFLKKYISRKTH